MKRAVLWTLVGCISTIVIAAESVAAPEMTAAEIVEKNVAARGGLESWKKIQTMVWVGHIESVHAPVPNLPFVLEMKRPNKTRFEITAPSQNAVRVYDGSNGWKMHPTPNGKPNFQPYTPQELEFAHDGQGFDGPLMDYQAKGIAIALDGVDEIEGHEAYRLSVKLPSGAAEQVWIDTQTFLDVRYDRESRNANDPPSTVSKFYRNYREIERLNIPFTIENGPDTARSADKMIIDKISLNPLLDDRTFAGTGSPMRHNVISVDTFPHLPVRSEIQPGPSPLELSRLPTAGGSSP